MIFDKLKSYINGKHDLDENNMGDISSIFDEDELSISEINEMYLQLEKEKQEMFDDISLYIEKAYTKTANSNDFSIELEDFVNQFISNLSTNQEVNSWIKRKFTTEEGLPKYIKTRDTKNLVIIKKIIRDNYKLLKSFHTQKMKKIEND
jgi:hypothetical protein